MRGQTPTTKPLSPGTPPSVKSQPEQHLCHLPLDLMLLFLECAGVYRSQGETSAALRCPRTGPRCPTAQRTSISVPAGDTSTSAETRSLQDESSDLPGFLSQYISPVRAKSGHFKPTTSCEDQVRQPSLCVGQVGQDGHGRVPQAAPPVPIW